MNVARIGPPSPRLVTREVGTEVAIYDSEGQVVSLLNQTASDIWQLCDGTQTLDEIVHTLAASYGVPPPEIRDEVAAQVREWEEKGLLA